MALYTTCWTFKTTNPKFDRGTLDCKLYRAQVAYTRDYKEPTRILISSNNVILYLIMESLVKKKQKGAILKLKRRHLNNTIFCIYTPYPAMKIRRISASSAQETRNDQFPIRRIHYNQYAICTAVHQWCMTQSSTKELLSPLENPEQVLRSRRKLFDNPSLVELNPPKDDQLSEIEEHIQEEIIEIMAETMEQYMSKTREDYGGSEQEDANEHIEKVLEIVDLFHMSKVTQDQIMLRAFPVSLTGVANSKGAIPSKTVAAAKTAIQEMAEYSQKWHNRTSSRTRSTETSDGLGAIQAQLNNLGWEIKKVN
ncbi:hypothetical protein Tco_0946933 [Tanacetum coccineum]